MVKTQSSNFDAEWRNGNDSEMWRESWQISSSFPPSCGFISI